MINSLLILIFFILTGPLFSYCNAADIRFIDSNQPDSINIIVITGDIASGDGDKFDLVSRSSGRYMVVLDSIGGSVQAALQIGAKIRMTDTATIVPPKSTCYSACALIWVSGARRYMSDDSSIGFHAAYIYKRGIPSESGMSNAIIGSYLTHLGLGLEAIKFITQAPPDKVNILTFEKAKYLGIDVEHSIDYRSRAIKSSPPPTRQRVWYADWGSGIIAYATMSNCGVGEFEDMGFDKSIISTIPIHRLTRKTDAYSIYGNRAITVKGCWKSYDGINLKAVLRRKKDGRTWYQDIKLDDGSWRTED